MKYFIANWKANKNIEETQNWTEEFSEAMRKDALVGEKLNSGAVSIIICPPFPLISILKPLEQTFKNIFIGTQSLSDKSNGAFTGEVTAENLKGLVSYSILGHSERRSNYGETNEILAEKTKLALSNNITPVFCIRDTNDTIPEGVTYIAYEPVTAIGTGNNMMASEVLAMKKELSLPENSIFIYGGSVNPETISHYLQNDGIQGFLIGSASLKPDTFLDILKKA